MSEIFETVLILSLFGFGITAVLLFLKPITSKRFPALWQYYIWIAVMFSMIFPAYKLIPINAIQKIPVIHQEENVQSETAQELDGVPQTVIAEKTPVLQREINITPNRRIKLINFLSCVWLVGVFIYIAVIVSSYVLYITRKRRNSVIIEKNDVLSRVKEELKIKRNIKIRMSDDFESPMLVGILLPKIYIPCREISDENMRMVFLHELTHYKRKDLLFKWIALFVNAVHWFNPLSYLICSNISEACEVSCDMAVTKNMSDEEQKTYMKTILDLVE